MSYRAALASLAVVCVAGCSAPTRTGEDGGDRGLLPGLDAGPADAARPPAARTDAGSRDAGTPPPPGWTAAREPSPGCDVMFADDPASLGPRVIGPCYDAAPGCRETRIARATLGPTFADDTHVYVVWWEPTWTGDARTGMQIETMRDDGAIVFAARISGDCTLEPTLAHFALQTITPAGYTYVGTAYVGSTDRPAETLRPLTSLPSALVYELWSSLALDADGLAGSGLYGGTVYCPWVGDACAWTAPDATGEAPSLYALVGTDLVLTRYDPAALLLSAGGATPTVLHAPADAHAVLGAAGDDSWLAWFEMTPPPLVVSLHVAPFTTRADALHELTLDDASGLRGSRVAVGFGRVATLVDPTRLAVWKLPEGTRSVTYAAAVKPFLDVVAVGPTEVAVRAQAGSLEFLRFLRYDAFPAP